VTFNEFEYNLKNEKYPLAQTGGYQLIYYGTIRFIFLVHEEPIDLIWLFGSSFEQPGPEIATKCDLAISLLMNNGQEMAAKVGRDRLILKTPTRSSLFDPCAYLKNCNVF
jgi:hypothetical protein